MPNPPARRKRPQEILRHVLDLDLADAELVLCLASVEENGLPTYQRLNITHQVADEFRNIVRAVRSRLNGGETVLREYAAGSKPDVHELEHLQLADFPEIEVQFDPLDAPVDLPVFGGEDPGFLAGLRFYALVLQPKVGEPVYWFRAYSKKRELGHSKAFGLWFKEGQFDHITDPVFLFDQYLDCFATDGWMFIVKQDGFQKIFRYYEMIKEAANETLSRIEAKIPMLNFDEFQQACQGHLQKLAKLRNIANKPYLDNVSISDLKRAIKKFDLPIQVKRHNGEEVLVYDPSDRWAILRLLDDDYLASVMTTELYEVTGKRVHPQGRTLAAG